MRVLIHYWTTTGNTRLAADLAATGLREAGAEVTGPVDMRSGAAPHRMDFDLWVIASPVYAFRPALGVTDFLAGLQDLPPVPTAALLTCAAFVDRAPSKLARTIRRTGARPWDWTTLRCEDAWPIARKYLPWICSYGAPTQQEKARFQAWWRAVPDRLDRGDAGRSWFRLPTPMTILSMAYARWFVRYWFRIRVDLDICTRCGVCERQCPTGKMRIGTFPAPRGDCLGCYGCVNSCPEGAVRTFLTREVPRYRGPG